MMTTVMAMVLVMVMVVVLFVVMMRIVTMMMFIVMVLRSSHNSQQRDQNGHQKDQLFIGREKALNTFCVIFTAMSNTHGKLKHGCTIAVTAKRLMRWLELRLVFIPEISGPMLFSEHR